MRLDRHAVIEMQMERMPHESYVTCKLNDMNIIIIHKTAAPASVLALLPSAKCHLEFGRLRPDIWRTQHNACSESHSVSTTEVRDMQTTPHTSDPAGAHRCARRPNRKLYSCGRGGRRQRSWNGQSCKS